MFYQDVLTGQNRANHLKMFAEYGALVDEANRLLLGSTWEAVGLPTAGAHHTTVRFIVRHIAELIDGIAILTQQGSVEPSQSLIRAALESVWGLEYLMESDTPRRGLAYQAAWAHQRIATYRRYDATHTSGQAFRNQLKDAPMAEVFDRIPFDLGKKADELEKVLREPDFVPIETEWQRLVTSSKGKKTPAWYFLFGGPNNVRELAYRLKDGPLYETYYRDGSGYTHGTDSLSNVAMDSNDVTYVRPVRHPNGIEEVCTFSVTLAMRATKLVLPKYDSAKWNEVREQYKSRIMERRMRLIEMKPEDRVPLWH